MSVSEPARLALYNRLGEIIGPEHAETLMASLPIQPAVELATKDDANRLDRRIDEVMGELRELRSEFHQFHKALRNQLIATIGAMTALTGIFSVIVGIIT